MIAHEQPQLYIVLSQTGTLLSRLLKVITGAEYNHASISLSPDLTRMYSFGRRHPYNPFWGGFITESPTTGTFKRFSNTRARVLALDISEEQHEAIHTMLTAMLAEKNKYHYNYIGLGLAAFHICHRMNYRYYCSEFVRDVLLHSQINGSEQLQPIVQPIHFLDLPYAQTVYCGRLRDYAAPPTYQTA